MIELKNTLNAWQTSTFNDVLKDELGAADPALLPLQAGLTQGSYVAEDQGFTVMVINARENNGQIQVKTGIFYASVIAGCACADDPTPLDICTEYCELQVNIDIKTAKTSVTLMNHEAHH